MLNVAQLRNLCKLIITLILINSSDQAFLEFSK